MPIGQQLTLTETLFDQLGDDAPMTRPGDWEVGRLVLAPEYRSDVDALRHCLFIALDYASRHTHIDTLYATCTAVLARLYRRFSFQAFAKDVQLGATQKTYTLISGHVAQVSQTLGGRAAAAVAVMN